jgi:hypothetical protein
VNAIWLKAGIPAVTLLLAVCCAPIAMADAGESTAPAAGTPTVPSASASTQASTGPTSAHPQASSSSAGTSGVTRKPDTEAGVAPSPPTGSAGQRTLPRQ